MIGDPAPNTTARPYRSLSVQEVSVPLVPDALLDYLLGREVYRRTDYLVLRNGQAAALAAVRRAEGDGLFAPVVEARVLAGPAEFAWVEAPDTDVGNATALAAVARRHARPGQRGIAVLGRFAHVNFIWDPAPLPIRVSEVVPPEPAKLLAMAEQAVAFDEDLPPIELRLDAVDVRDLATGHRAERYLLPCRGSGIDLGAPVEFLDTRPARRGPWTLIGCERSMQLHRHFYGDEPPQVDLCPRNRAWAGDGAATLTKCCLLERGLEVDGSTVVVPWGANLDEVRSALRLLTLVDLEGPAALAGAGG